VSLNKNFLAFHLFIPLDLVTTMTDSSEILRLLTTERDRYILEAADIERRLSLIKNQVNTLEALLSGYVQEDQMYQSLGRLSNLSSTQALLQESTRQVAQNQEISPPPSTTKTSAFDDVDVSDIPKLAIARKPGALILLPEYRDYSILNAVLILMRRHPETHMHVDAIIRDLYGDELDTQEFKMAKATVSKMLSTGTQQGVWHRVLHTQGMYTLNYEKGVTTRPVKKRR
jgi:hypothetical protein